MTVRISIVLALFLGFTSGGTAATLDGSVFLFPVTSSFSSAGDAHYYNDLGQEENATLSGDHNVNQTNGNASYVVAVTGTRGYFYKLEGPANAGACFATWLHVIAVPEVPPIAGTRQYERSWNGPEIKCAPLSQQACTNCACDGTLCQQSPTCPIILDLNGDGIHTTGLGDPVRFWTDYEGAIESTAWTAPNTEEGFLWIDLNEDHVAQVSELFGSRMTRPNGDRYPNGYEALSQYDRQEFGGDGDGRITSRDRVWSRLKLWVDRNHDGISQSTEISVPAAHGIIALNLNRARAYAYDVNGNQFYLVGSYDVRAQGNEPQTRLMVDGEFRYLSNE